MMRSQSALCHRVNVASSSWYLKLVTVQGHIDDIAELSMARLLIVATPVLKAAIRSQLQ